MIFMQIEKHFIIVPHTYPQHASSLRCCCCDGDDNNFSRFPDDVDRCLPACLMLSLLLLLLIITAAQEVTHDFIKNKIIVEKKMMATKCAPQSERIKNCLWIYVRTYVAEIENISQAIFKHAKLNNIIDYAAATLVYITMSNRACTMMMGRKFSMMGARQFQHVVKQRFNNSTQLCLGFDVRMCVRV